MRSGLRAGGERLLDLGDRSGVEARAEPGEQIEDLGRRIGLDRVKDARVGQRLGEGEIIVAHDFEVDDQARPVVLGSGEEVLDAIRHIGASVGRSRCRRARASGSSAMRIADRAVETRPVSVDPPPRPHVSRSTRLESRGRRASRDQMLRRGRLGLTGQKPAPLSQPSFGGEESLPHARQDRQASSVSRPLEGRRRPKKPGPSLLQVASPVWRGTPVRLRLPVFARRLTGLLSRSPPTDTRPQARAYWARWLFVRIALKCKRFFRLATPF